MSNNERNTPKKRTTANPPPRRPAAPPARKPQANPAGRQNTAPVGRPPAAKPAAPRSKASPVAPSGAVSNPPANAANHSVQTAAGERTRRTRAPQLGQNTSKPNAPRPNTPRAPGPPAAQSTPKAQSNQKPSAPKAQDTAKAQNVRRAPKAQTPNPAAAKAIDAGAATGMTGAGSSGRRGGGNTEKAVQPRLRVISLGGLGEIGKNLTVVEYANDIVIVDCGSIFPSDDMMGVDLVIPDVTYLQQNREKIRGMLITHGHEDHIGSIPYVLKLLGGAPLPIYGTRLTLALIEHKLKEHRLMASADMRTVQAGDVARLGGFDVEFIHVNHSIIDAVALAIKTPVGVLVFTGDFKIDFTPIDGQVTDLQRFAELGRRGVLALFMDSTNVERPGYTMSERRVGEAFESLFPQAQGRIIIAMFSSNLHRVQQVVDAAVRFNRMVCLTGRSMLNYSTVARDLGLLKIPEGRIIGIDDLDRYPDDEVVVITTGSQGENMAGLSRMAFDEHRKLTIRKSDMVVISASPIPGNEKSVSRVINQLFVKGANVIYESLADVHVSGHACQEELKLMHALIKPKFFVPVHGEYRHQKRHSNVARAMGLSENNVAIASIGDVIEFTRNSMRIAGQVPAGQMLIDGSGIGDVGNVVLRDRKLLSQDGLLVIVLPVDIGSGHLHGDVEIVSRGFIYMRESEELIEEIRNSVRKAVERGQVNKAVDINFIKNAVRDDVRDLLYKRTKRSPMVIPVVVESGGAQA